MATECSNKIFKNPLCEEGNVSEKHVVKVENASRTKKDKTLLPQTSMFERLVPDYKIDWKISVLKKSSYLFNLNFRITLFKLFIISKYDYCSTLFFHFNDIVTK